MGRDGTNWIDLASSHARLVSHGRTRAFENPEGYDSGRQMGGGLPVNFGFTTALKDAPARIQDRIGRRRGSAIAVWNYARDQPV